MRRATVYLLVVLAILLVAQIRLSRSGSELGRTGHLPPELWENTNPPGRPSPPPVVVRTASGVSVTHPSPSSNCPTIVSTDPESQFTLTSLERGVQFDIDGDGDLERVAWTVPESDVAFLTLDSDGDGGITSGREMIGDRTLPGAANGPNALNQLASDGATTWSQLNTDHSLFARILLWRDANHNGVSEPGELRPASEELAAIGLGYQRHGRMDVHGNRSRFRGFVHVRTAAAASPVSTFDDERARRRFMYDVCLVAE
jgi:hypothetical protein